MVGFRSADVAITWLNQLATQLTIVTQDFGTGQTVRTPYYADTGEWFYIPRGCIQDPEFHWFTQHLDLSSGSTAGAPIAAGAKFRDYIKFGVAPFPADQPKFIDDIVSASLANNLGGLAVAPTRSGKTLCSIAAALKLGRKTLVLTHSKVLLDQWRDNVQQHVVDGTGRHMACGRITGSSFDTHTDFTVATVQTLSRRNLPDAYVESIGTVIVDETHICPSDVAFTALRKLKPRTIVGLTATPRRGDGKGRAIQWLVGKKIASLHREMKAKVYYVHYPYESDKCGTISDKTGRMKKPRLTIRGRVSRAGCARAMFANPDFLKSFMAHMINLIKDGRHVIIMVELKDNVNLLLKEFHKLGVYPGAFFGSVTQQEGKHEMTKNPCIVTRAKCGVGVDFQPPPTAFVLALPLSDCEQAIGRGLQPQAPMEPIILDFVIGAKSFVKMARKRDRIYRSKGLEVTNEVWPRGYRYENA